jgi:hypothetical protein
MAKKRIRIDKVPPLPVKTDDNAMFVARTSAEYHALAKKSKFIQNPLSVKFFKKFQVDDDDFRNSFNMNLTDDFLSYLYWKVKYDEPVNLSIYGTQRGGKSGMGMGIGLFLSELTKSPFPADASHILKNPSIFLRMLPDMKEHGAYIVDEQKVSRTQSGSVSEEWEISDVAHIIAKKCINQIWIAPVLFPERDSEYALKVIGLDRRLAMTKALLIDLKNSEDGFYRMFGYVVWRHYDATVSVISPAKLIKMADDSLTAAQLLRKNYELKKDEWIEEIKARMSSDRNLQRIEEAYILTMDSLFVTCKNNLHRKTVARVLLPAGYTEDEIEEIIKLAGDRALVGRILMRTIGSKSYNKFVVEARRIALSRGYDLSIPITPASEGETVKRKGTTGPEHDESDEPMDEEKTEGAPDGKLRNMPKSERPASVRPSRADRNLRKGTGKKRAAHRLPEASR